MYVGQHVGLEIVSATQLTYMSSNDSNPKYTIEEKIHIDQLYAYCLCLAVPVQTLLLMTVINI